MTAQVVLAALLVLQALLLGGAKVLQLAPMRERAEHVGFTAADYQRIGLLELLAAGGVLVGLAVLAGCGLLLLLGGALVAHVRAGDRPPALAPALVVAALATGYVVATYAAR